MSRTKLVSLNSKFKNELDYLFLNKSHVDSNTIVKEMSDDWCEHYDYGDVQEYRMCNDGFFPGTIDDGYVYSDGPVYHVDTHINTEVVDSILKFYNEEDGANKTLEELAHYLYYDENIRKGLGKHFENVVWWRKVKELSTRNLKKEKGIRYNRPRMFELQKSFFDQPSFVFVQPDRRKPVYYVVSGHGIVLDERTIVNFDWK